MLTKYSSVFKSRIICCAVWLCLTAVARTALPFTGVNLTGPEWTNGPFWPNRFEIDFFASRGMNIFRLPFAWEFLQPQMSGEFDSAVWNSYVDIVTYITETKQLYVIVDPHNYARYNGKIIGSEAPLSALTDLWTRLANHFKDNSRVIFGIMNEPTEMSTTVWANNANATLQAIRATQATNLVLVPGNGWTGAGFWLDNWYDTSGSGVSNAVALLNIADPGNNYAYEVHTYFDSISSGGSAPCVNPPVVPSHFEAVTGWLKQYGRRGFLGEFGGSEQLNCLLAFNETLNYLEANSDVWIGWTYWAGGPRYASSHLSVEPVGYPPRENEQLLTIMNHMQNQIVSIQYPDITPASCNNGAAQVIYDDELQSPWNNWSWATNTFSDPKSASGTSSISFIPALHGAVYLVYDGNAVQNISLSGYNAVEFWVAADDPGGQVIEVSFWYGYSRPWGASQPVSAYIEGNKITSTFKKVVIPLEVLDVVGQSLSGISWSDGTGGNQTRVYLDDIKLVCTTISGGSLSGTQAPQAPQASQTQGPQASQTPQSQSPQTRTPSQSSNISSASLLCLSALAFVFNFVSLVV